MNLNTHLLGSDTPELTFSKPPPSSCVFVVDVNSFIKICLRHHNYFSLYLSLLRPLTNWQQRRTVRFAILVAILKFINDFHLGTV